MVIIVNVNTVVIRYIRVRFKIIKRWVCPTCTQLLLFCLFGYHVVMNNNPGCVGGGMDGRKSRFKDCLQQSKIFKP